MTIINRSNPLPDGQALQADNYQGEPSLTANKVGNEVVDRSLAAIKLFGVSITGMDPRLIGQAQLLLTIPMKAGQAKIIGVDRDARVSIQPDCVAKVELKLGRNQEGALALEHFSLQFSQSIKIRNPSSSLEPRPGKSYVGRKIKDKLAKVTIRKLSIDGNGQLSVDGQISVMHMAKKRLPHTLTPMTMPALDESALGRLGIIGASDGPHIKTKIASLSQKFDVKKILKNIGAITNEATFDLSISGDPARASFLKNNNLFQGPMAPVNIRLAGTADMNQEGNLQVLVDGTQSKIASSLGTFCPHVQARITRVADDKPMKVHLVGEVIGVSQSISLDTFSKKEVKSVMPRRRQGPMTGPTPSAEDDFNMSYGAKAVELQGHIDVKAKVRNGLQEVKGSGRAKVRAHEPFAKTHERGITLGGSVSAQVEVKKFSYRAGFGVADTSATAKFGIHPDELTRKRYPEIRSVEFKYRAEISGPGQVEITPPAFGASRIVRPVKNFEGHDERVDTNLTRTNFRPIGSKEYFRHVEKITGAKPRHADQVELLIDGVKSMPKRMALIKEAKNIICFQTLVFKNDASGWQYAQALVAAAKRGVRVVGVVDAIGNVESFKDLTRPNPIYEYLRDNGVELRLYNGFLEDGLRKIIDIAQRYPGIFSTFDTKSVLGIAEILRFFEQVADVAAGHANPLPTAVRGELQNAIHALMNGQVGVSPHNSVQELKQILSGNMTTFDELLLAIKRMGDVSYRWHEKYLMVDGEKAIVGGMNIADEYLHGGSGEMVHIKGKSQPAWRDSDVFLSGEIVTDVFKSFRHNWLHVAQEQLELPHKIVDKKGLDLIDGCTVSMIQHRPLPDGDHNVTNFLLYNLRTLKAGEKAWFETAYFLPRGVLRSLQKEMVAAAKRGVDVRILTNSETTSDFGPLVEAAVFDTRELLRAGARVFHRNHDRMVHAKVSVLGDKLTMIGSWNMDNRSASHDSEDVCAIYDAGITKQMSEQLMVDMFEQSDEITLAEVGKRAASKEIRSAGMLLMGELA